MQLHSPTPSEREHANLNISPHDEDSISSNKALSVGSDRDSYDDSNSSLLVQLDGEPGCERRRSSGSVSINTLERVFLEKEDNDINDANTENRSAPNNSTATSHVNGQCSSGSLEESDESLGVRRGSLIIQFAPALPNFSDMDGQCGDGEDHVLFFPFAKQNSKPLVLEDPGSPCSSPRTTYDKHNAGCDNEKVRRKGFVRGDSIYNLVSKPFRFGRKKSVNKVTDVMEVDKENDT